jgi:ABC-2 type transport system permease protein
MSAAAQAEQAAPDTLRAGGTRLRDVLQAEWTKLRTVSGPSWLVLAIVVLTVAVSTAAVGATSCPRGTTCQVDTTKLTLTGIQLGQAVVAILAVQAVSYEYSTGMIRVTLAAMPRRDTVLAAKAIITGALVLLAGALAVLGSVLAGALILPGHGFAAGHGFHALSLGYGPTLRAAGGSVLYLGLVAMLGTGVAAALRDSGVAVGAVLGLLYLFPIVTAFVGNPVWQRRLDRYSPMAGLNIQATTGLKNLAISPWAGLGVLAIWAAGALLGGGMLLCMRDA